MNMSLISFPGIENLPCELQRNFTLMRDLDNRTEGDYLISLTFAYWLFWVFLALTCQNICEGRYHISVTVINVFSEKKGEIEKLAEEYIATVKNLASEQRVEHLQKIQNAYSKCKEFSDDKVQLAMQTYEMVSPKPADIWLNSQSIVLDSQCVGVFYVTCSSSNLGEKCFFFTAGRQTHPQTGCRSCALWEWAKGETGSEQLWQRRGKRSEKYAESLKGFNSKK